MWTGSRFLCLRDAWLRYTSSQTCGSKGRTNSCFEVRGGVDQFLPPKNVEKSVQAELPENKSCFLLPRFCVWIFLKQNSCISYCHKLFFRDTTIRWLYRKLIVSVHLYSGLKQKETIIFGFRLLKYVFYVFTCRSHSAPLLGSCRNRFKNVWMLLFALLIFPGTLTGAWTLGWRGQKCVL